MVAYQAVSFLSVLAVLVWALRSRNPFNLGAILGGFMLWGFDWLWCSRGFWNATTAGGLIMFPGLHIQGVTYPIAVACNWCFGYGFVPLLASKFYPQISRALGVWHVPVVLLVGAALDMAVEWTLIVPLGVYEYHQAPQYLFFGGPVWSNTWMLGGLLTAAYFGLHFAAKWAALPERAGFALNAETTWKGVFMAAWAILTSAFLLGVAQYFWFSAVSPWVGSGRPF